MMKKILICLLVTSLILIPAVPAMAARPLTPKVLEAVFIHYENPAKPAKPPAPPPEPKVYDYYELLGPKWDVSLYADGIPYVINPTRAPAGAEAEVKAAFEAWDMATGAELFTDTPEINLNSWWGAEDGKNNISWQVITTSGVIAATWIWYWDNDGSGTMSPGDVIKETDMVFNATMKWGIDADDEGTVYKLKNTYDVHNIATHEVGHIVGLDDLYETKYSEITMYGYGAKAETKKISLETGDINGVKYLYDSVIP